MSEEVREIENDNVDFVNEVTSLTVGAGTVTGIIKRAKLTEKGDISMGIQLDESDGKTMVSIDSEGNEEETDQSVKGEFLNYMILLPRDEHRGVYTKNGQEKWQWRVNMVSADLKNLGLLDEGITTKDALIEFLKDGGFAGMEVIAKVKIEKGQDGMYQGRIPLAGLKKLAD